MELKVLVVDDEDALREEVVEFLEVRGFLVDDAPSPSIAFEKIKENEPNVLILDLKLPEMSGFEVLEKVKSEYPAIEVIMVTGHGDSDSVLQALRLGAFDFFHKPFDVSEVEAAIKRTEKYIGALQKLEIESGANRLLSESINKDVGNMIGSSPAIKQVVAISLKAAAASNTSVLITGPSGVGKELVARVIHFASERKAGRFLTLNCSAIPDTLMESEIFGHKRGAFTGANEDRPGAFEVANGGTLFLDEIGDMPLASQAKLLRILEDGKVKRLGEQKERASDVRVVAATNKDLKIMASKGEFREDLYFRINTVEIKVPSLSERKEDIPALVDFFVNKNIREGKSVTITQAALDKLLKYSFPGNIRELRNMVERAIIISESNVLEPKHFYIAEPQDNVVSEKEEKAKAAKTEVRSDAVFDTYNLAEIEEKVIRTVLEKNNFHQTRSSEELGISINALGRKMKKYNIAIMKNI